MAPGRTLSASPRARPLASGPNLRILIADDQAAYTLGLEGDRHHATPNLDRPAGEGGYFERAYCDAPVCSPSRQAFLTGKYPHANGVSLLNTPLPNRTITLGDWLSARGYRTGALGKMHFNSPTAHGFAERADTPQWLAWLRAHPPEGGDQSRPWRPFRDPPAQWLNAEARDCGLPLESCEATYFVDRARQFFQEHHDEPFALVVSFHEPHAPCPFPRGWPRRYAPGDFSVPPVAAADRIEQPGLFDQLKAPEIQGIPAAYDTSLGYVDDHDRRDPAGAPGQCAG